MHEAGRAAKPSVTDSISPKTTHPMTNAPPDPRATAQVKDWIRLACLMEATARKPGNVHPNASFEDLSYEDFVLSAGRISPFLANTPRLGVGRAIFSAVEVTRRALRSNCNLGVVLVIAPLAAVPLGTSLTEGISDVLSSLTERDATLAYEAIRVARPGGLGKALNADISEGPQGTLLDVMKLAADRDLVAAQYATDFHLVLTEGLPLLDAAENFTQTWEDEIVRLHLTLMSRHPDTLIARKCGIDEARTSAEMASSVLDAGWPDTPEGIIKLRHLDRWLRAVENRRNPGTTADLVTGSLFAAMREGCIQPPSEEEIEESGQPS